MTTGIKRVLTDAAVITAKVEPKARKIHDGGDLYLFVTPTGLKSWRYKYRLTPSFFEEVPVLVLRDIQT
ncbi:Arm DNA-binding domain-containing protein [Thiomicrospira microaerophila]|uniref:Arm DNA-binding domain-containing protein n=1 Tax=Thiomicrospira microaerophila TaxID=406020 RepID=UPI0005CB739D|nr:Arm DNA-binding domain-containing protein [Thiomicrospira microaerophila]